jgi:hypothetical protein
MDPTLGFWLFVAPNYILAAAMYTLIGRYLLSLVFKPESELVIWRAFVNITDPILFATRAVTPAVVPNGLVMVLAIFWVIMLRIVLSLLLLKLGVPSRVTG